MIVFYFHSQSVLTRDCVIIYKYTLTQTNAILQYFSKSDINQLHKTIKVHNYVS